MVNYVGMTILNIWNPQSHHNLITLSESPADLTTGAISFSNAYFGRGSGGIFLSNVGCTGAESSLLSCTNPGIGVHSCDHSNDAGVRCLGMAATVMQ